MNKVGWIIFSVAVVALLGGLVAWTRITNPPIDVSNVENNTILAASEQSGNIGDHTSGSDSKKIMFIEYGDFQCPSCEGAYPNVSSLLEEYGDKITFVFRNFPLTSIHPNARAAAAVAEAAGLQGKFWEMYDILYGRQGDWDSLDVSKRGDMFNTYAKELNLDVEKFKTDVAGPQVAKKINFDLALGKQYDVAATPSFFLNGEALDETTANGIVQGDLTSIKAKLDALIAENK